MAQILVGEIKIIRITNNRNGLYKELEYNKYSNEEIIKMIEFYNQIKVDFNIDICTKFIKEVTND